MSYTPGPWSANAIPADRREAIGGAVGRAGRWVVTGVPAAEGGPGTVAVVVRGTALETEDREAKRDEANARLIAAAPALLATCEAALIQVEEYLTACGPGYPSYRTLDNVSKILRAALRAAKGE